MRVFDTREGTTALVEMEEEGMRKGRDEKESMGEALGRRLVVRDGGRRKAVPSLTDGLTKVGTLLGIEGRIG